MIIPMNKLINRAIYLYIIKFVAGILFDPFSLSFFRYALHNSFLIYVLSKTHKYFMCKLHLELLIRKLKK